MRLRGSEHHDPIILTENEGCVCVCVCMLQSKTRESIDAHPARYMCLLLSPFAPLENSAEDLKYDPHLPSCATTKVLFLKLGAMYKQKETQEKTGATAACAASHLHRKCHSAC